MHVLVVFVFLVVIWMVLVRIYEALRKYPPSCIGVPLLGRLPMIIRRVWQTPGSNVFRELACDGACKGDVWCTFLGMRRVVGLTSYDAIFEALSRRGNDFAFRPPLTDFIEHRKVGTPPKVGGIISSSGELWKEQRRFALSVMRDLGMGKNTTEKKIQLEARCLVQELQKNNGEAIEPNPVLTRAVSNIITQFVFGFRSSHEDYEFTTFNKLLKSILSDTGGTIILTIMFPALEGTFIAKFFGKEFLDVDQKLKAFIAEKVDQTIARVAETNNDGDPEHFVEAFLRKQETEPEGSSFCSSQLVMGVEDLYTAGSETTSTFLNWALLYLAFYRDWQKALQEEVDEELGEVNDVAYKDRLRCHKTMAFIDEIQRHASIVPHNIMHSVAEDCNFRGFCIPKGCFVIPNLYSVHHDPNIWVEPNQFQPSRFLNDEGEYQSSKFVIPYSIGKRACIGEGLARIEIFIFLTTILRSFDVDLDDEAKSQQEKIFHGMDLDIHGPKDHKVILTTRGRSDF